MEKVKRWHIGLIICVLLLTLFNILPTILYYSKPLSKSIGAQETKQIAKDIGRRSEQLHSSHLSWLKAFNKQLNLNPKSMQQNPNDSRVIEVEFDRDEDAALFKQYIAQAGALIPFQPAQIYLNEAASAHPRQVILQKRVSSALNSNYLSSHSTYIPLQEQNAPSKAYRNLVRDRITWLVDHLIKDTQETKLVDALKSGYREELSAPLMDAAQKLLTFEQAFRNQPIILQNFLKTFALADSAETDASQILVQSFDQSIAQSQNKLKDISNEDWQTKKLHQDISSLSRAKALVQNHRSDFLAPKELVNSGDIHEQLSAFTPHQTIDLFESHPFIASLLLDWNENKITFNLRPEIQSVLQSSSSSEEQREILNQNVINSIAKLTHESSELIQPYRESYQLSFHKLADTQALLALDLAPLAQREVNHLQSHLNTFWNRKSLDLKEDAFPIQTYLDHEKADYLTQKFGLVLHAPLTDSKGESKGFNSQSIYVIAKGVHELLEKYQFASNTAQAEQFYEDFQELKELLFAQGFQFNYVAAGSQYPEEFQNSFVFEKPEFYRDYLTATREDFRVVGNGQYAFLELSDVAHRLHVLNKIESEKHEELIKWKEEHQAAKVDLHRPQSRYFIPPPTQNVLVQNFLLSAKKYFRGDASKVLKWGLDLSGGKSILIGLKDQNNQPITQKDELTQGVNELTQRVNKMGLSEVDIRLEGQNISLDFPSSKGLSAQELIKGSSMAFHVINEKFSSPTSPHSRAIQKFLQEVWNEASLSHQNDLDSLNYIAWKHLGGVEGSEEFNPRSEHAKELYEAGLRLPSPKMRGSSSDVDSTYSKIVPYSGTDYASWRGQSHPLVVVLNNYALEGSHIENIRTSYEPKEGNLLAFNIKGSVTSLGQKKVHPRDNLHAWTSLYAKDRILGTPLEKWTPSRGWRLAIVLNDRVINDPQLNQALRDNVQVSGGFTQQEVNRLAADLKAGSLSYKPDILSENNVSADLGQKERIQGITATLIALALVIALMIAYYRFSGVVASFAVLVNLLVIWAILQNLGATLTLSGIAGIILTLGMAVDANVLVFERIREELKKGKKLAHALSQGYKHAFSAIFDSNVTTVLAALILLNFDTGPIKGLAITLTIGITSSMFTALFMTQVFFNSWVQKTHSTTLNMANWFKVKSFQFLKHAKGVTLAFSALILIGCTLFVIQKKSIFGMDFTGGYSLNVSLEQKQSKSDLRSSVRQALLSAGAKSTDFQIRELNSANSLRIQLSSALEEKGRPFYGLPTELDLKNPRYLWQKNPRIDWIVQALKGQGLAIEDSSLKALDTNWSEMSGQLSKTTRNHAFIGLSLAFVFILIYLSMRFEVRFALSALVCIFHDVLMSLALLALLHAFGVSVQMNMQVIAALMTIIGYSLNDTIIVFDRIREEMKLKRKASFTEIINHSLSVTLNRTLMTSLTTFIVLLSLLFLGGSKIFDFSLMMSLGVVIGTLSSLFVAPLVLYYTQAKEPQKSSKVHVLADEHFV